jgi:uncharacterized DUF497 family protein
MGDSHSGKKKKMKISGRLMARSLLLELDRFLSIGRSEAGRLLVVAYTERNNHIRIITARLSTSREARHYESKSSQ